ncbi:MAG: NAD(P)/FAD-dependent oxidoreductase [Dongiaceae bacterium]
MNGTVNRSYDLAIVGAGFAGLVCARSAALRGLRTLVVDRKPEPGARVHTTGILVKEVAERWEVPSRLTRRIHGVRLYGPSLRHIDLASPGYYFLATDTPALLGWFCRAAGRAGAEIRFGRPYRGARRDREWLELDGLDRRARFLVGADGSRSAVARDFGLGRNRSFLIGVEAEYDGVVGIDDDKLHCFVDPHLAQGYIAWVVPGVGNIAQVGLACRPPHRPDLPALKQKLSRLFDFRAARIVARRAGLIPIGGRVQPFATDRVLLVGDAAGIVSPLTAGGIHTALESGWRAAHAIADYLQDNGVDPARAVVDSYPRFFWKRQLRRLIDLPIPAPILDLLLATPPLRALAQSIYFHHRGLLSPRGWQDFIGNTERARAGRE